MNHFLGWGIPNLNHQFATPQESIVIFSDDDWGIQSPQQSI